MVGLFFGSFNPIHQAHIAIAQYIIDKQICQSVQFVISPCNPFKQQSELLNERQRLLIAQVSLDDCVGLSVSDIEFDMPRPSYTIDTLRRLQSQHPTDQFALIMGGDNLRSIHLWKEYRTILDEFQVLVYPRPNEDLSGIMDSHVKIVDAPLLAISSTEIRTRIKNNQPIIDLIKPQAEELIRSFYSSFLK